MTFFNISASEKTFDSLTLALELLEAYRDNMEDIDSDANISHLTDSIFPIYVTKKYYEFMDSLKIILVEMDPVRKSQYFKAFKILVDIAFDKMESDIRNIQ